eukprot:TRINITY_DN16613_c0_g1_i9.p1 TRINITY_DN16613_c0_g1~~TRINITY_DN16613_c0_g1_i9.p1  ORF type:complete len:606 (-),score=50.39 TRINITY_DN16613_c0_g1_i9:317-1981(-)
MLSKYVCCIVLICGLLEGTLQEGFTSSSFHFGSTSSGDGDVKTYRVEYSVDSETLRRALGLFFNCLTERAKQMQIEVQNPLQSVQALASQQTAQATYALSKEMSFALLNMNKGVFDVCAPDDQVPLCEEEIIGWLEFLSGIVSGREVEDAIAILNIILNAYEQTGKPNYCYKQSEPGTSNIVATRPSLLNLTQVTDCVLGHLSQGKVLHSMQEFAKNASQLLQQGQTDIATVLQKSATDHKQLLLVVQQLQSAIQQQESTENTECVEAKPIPGCSQTLIDFINTHREQIPERDMYALKKIIELQQQQPDDCFPQFDMCIEGEQEFDPTCYCRGVIYDGQFQDVQHPTDCQQYINCMLVDGGIAATIRSCPQGEFFDIHEGQCRLPQSMFPGYNTLATCQKAELIVSETNALRLQGLAVMMEDEAEELKNIEQKTIKIFGARLHRWKVALALSAMIMFVFTLMIFLLWYKLRETYNRRSDRNRRGRGARGGYYTHPHKRPGGQPKFITRGFVSKTQNAQTTPGKLQTKISPDSPSASENGDNPFKSFISSQNSII